MNGPIDIQISTDRPLSEGDLRNLADNRLYTLFMRDFLNMPEMDFFTASKSDPEVQALFN